MRSVTIASMLVIAIVASAGVGLLVGYTNQREVTSTSVLTSTLPVVTTYTSLLTSTIQQTVTSSSTTTLTSYITYTPTVTAGCDLPSDLYIPLFAPATINSSENGQLAVVMTPGSNATIFVGYCPAGFIPTGPVTLPPSVTVESCTYGGECQGGPAAGITITAVPNQIMFENQSLSIAAYRLSANTSSTGYYAIYIPYQCPSVGLDVGHPANQLSHTDFTWMGPIPCGLSIGEIMSVVGANTTYVGLGTA